MKHIKLFEQFINESSRNDFPKLKKELERRDYHGIKSIGPIKPGDTSGAVQIIYKVENNEVAEEEYDSYATDVDEVINKLNLNYVLDKAYSENNTVIINLRIKNN